jgi:hypothetical protein
MNNASTLKMIATISAWGMERTTRTLMHTTLDRRGNGPYFPPASEIAYLQDPKVMEAIGAKVTYEECPIGPSYAFYYTADCASPPLLIFWYS